MKKQSVLRCLTLLFLLILLGIILITSIADLGLYPSNNKTFSKQIPAQESTLPLNPNQGSFDYFGEYSFTNDSVNDPPSGWNCTGSVAVQNSFLNHNKVVYLIDNGKMTNLFSNKLTGTVEYWWAIVNDSDTSELLFLGSESPECTIYFYFQDGYFRCISNYMAPVFNTICPGSSNTWYHIAVAWNASGWNVTIGTTTYGPYSFYYAIGTGMAETWIDSYAFSHVYIDAVDYSWSAGYYYNRNMLYNITIMPLDEEIALLLNYSAVPYNYYQTQTMASSAYYHVVWLKTTEISDDYNLYLYSDSYYSNLRTSSLRSGQALDWVVFRPTSFQYYYPETYRYSGTGDAYIEWESSTINITEASCISEQLNSSEYIETYQVSLSNSTIYDFSLTIPGAADYDLYLYYLDPGSETNYNGFIRKSDSIGNGINESILEFRPQVSSDYLIIITLNSGNGFYNFSYNSRNITNLSDDDKICEYYNSTYSSYFYQTSTAASSSLYHIITLQPLEIEDEFHLSLYNNYNYSNQIAASKKGAGELNWVIFRPSSSQCYYPKVDKYSGIGYANIEWKSISLGLSIGTPVSTLLNDSECMAIYTVSLTAGTSYNFTLDVPEGADYDLFLYYLNSGGSTNSTGAIRSSSTLMNGVDETIGDYRPLITDNYVLLVARCNGTGSLTLYSYSKSTVLLADDSAEYQSYDPSFLSYYYQTSTFAFPSYYHVVWLQPTEVDDDPNLFLYSDDLYSTLQASSTNSAGNLDWIVFRPSSLQYYYPTIDRSSGLGNAYIEWESGTNNISIGTSVSALLNASECIEIYQIYLCNLLQYNFSLSVPDTADYDLYLYYLPLGAATNATGYINSSSISGNGFDESIQNFSPQFTNYYSIFVVRKNGTGEYILNASNSVVNLSNDITLYAYYDSNSHYYYQTNTTASSSYYHVVWLQPLEIDDTFNLYLYSDSVYSNFQAVSTRGNGLLEWVVFRPSSSQYYYPRVHRYSGIGYANIQWKTNSSRLSIGTPVTTSLNASESIATYMVSLNSVTRYNFTLDVPEGADYDIYLYYLNSGGATNSTGAIRSSSMLGSGVDETIGDYRPPITGDYILLIVRQNGTGSFTLYSISQTILPLTDESAVYETYDASFTSSYYQTSSSASSSYYHAFWLQPLDIDDDFNLDLYSDIDYSVLRATSTRGAGALDWVVVRPSSSQFYYPRVYRYSGIGYGYIEWESSSSTLSIGTPISALLNISECIEIYMVYLTTGTNYAFTLDVPDGADYDLYLYYLSSGAATNSSGALSSSTNIGTGLNETIWDYEPSLTGYYLLLVARQNGTGTFTLYSYSQTTTSLTDELSYSETYDHFSYYYYQTGSTVSTSYYHAFWLQPADIDDDFNLNLYDDSNYSVLRGTSMRGAGALDWIVVRPSSSQYLYPRGHRYMGAGPAYIEWEVGSSLVSIGTPISALFDISECIEIYRVYLYNSWTYTFILDVPDGADYDLYLYYLSSGGATNSSGALISCTTIGAGINETISEYKPTLSDYYILLVARKSGTGSFTLYPYGETIRYLTDETANSETYYPFSYYYYQTSTGASPAYYHAFWLQPADIEDDFNLNLYSDSSYSVLRATSTRGAGALDWVVVRPSSLQMLYPRGHRYIGVGTAYIEWESGSSTLSIGTPLTASLDVSECIEVYTVYLSSSTIYNFTLDVPDGADYDLFLYYLSSGGATNSSGALRSSTRIGAGLDETIGAYKPTLTDYYILLVVRQTGAGSFTLYSYSRGVISISDESAYYDSYSSSFSSYYYQTGSTASSSYYHAFWLQPVDINDDFNLNLYSDSSYSVLRAASTRGAGALDWVVVRPSSSQYYYPNVYRYSDIGGAYIEWEVGSTTITIGNGISVSLSASECIEVFRVYLSAGISYTFTLDVPSGADYDLYLYYLSSGSATNSTGALRSSTKSGVGVDEMIDQYKPTLTDYYILLVTRQTGSGSFTLYTYSRGVISLSDESAYSEAYNLFSLFDYQTVTLASSSYYHAFWLQPQDVDDDFNLYLYSNSGYSILQASSTRGIGALDWVVVRPSSSQYFYPQGHRYTGTGTATIEWESSSSTLSFGSPVSATLSSTECVEIYMVYLCNFLRYNFSLSVPDTADYDLYLYYLAAGAAANESGFIRSSILTGNGVDEIIANFTPQFTDYYSIFVIRKAGSGSFTLLPSNTAIRLVDDKFISNLYNATDSYYYQTNTTASSSYYHTFWLQSVDIDDNFNLYLYSDSGYSVLRASSTSGAGALDWVVVRPSSSQYYYPRVYSYSGTGYGYIEWESGSSTISIGTPISGLLNISERIEIYRIYLTSGVNYNFTLDVPSGADYDLYLYYLTSGGATNSSGALRNSTRIGVGLDETIGDFRAPSTDYYILIVARQTGAGTFTLYSYSHSIISLTDETAYLEFYSTFTQYYYQTSSTASSSYYHAFWLQPQDVDDDFNLYLYSNSGYSVLQATSTRAAGTLDWVVIRPSSSQYYYPRGHRNTGIGNATIEWEASSSTLSIGSPVSATLSSMECIEIYMVYLCNFLRYNFSLSVPDTADYDLYLYYLAAGAAANESGSIRSSILTGNGVDEIIANFTPQFTDFYSIFVIRKAGSGSFTLFSSNSAIRLADDNSIYNFYSSADSYYYQTNTTASSSYYHLFWLQPVDVDDDFNLYLYSNSAYSTLRASSTRGIGALDWVMVRPSSSQYYYTLGHRYTGVGNAYIEWESGSTTLSIGTPISELLNISECIEIYRVYLTSGVNYNFTLDVPSGADYDLYLYYLSSGAATNQSGAVRSSATIGSGIDEEIGDFRATSPDYYILAVVRRNGNGFFTLYSYSRGLTTLADESAVYETYDASFSYYYYQTSSSASSSYYHLFWLQPIDVNDDFNLYLYSDTGYSTLQAASTSSIGALDWVIVRPSSSQYYYPKTHRNLGIGSAYLEWEVASSSLSSGYSLNSVLNTSECIEAYRATLSTPYTYNFNLDVPDGADYDLYLYYLSSGAATNQSGFIRSSRNLGSLDESILQYRPQISSDYIVLVVRKSGTGTFYLSSSSNTTYLYDESAVYEYYNSSLSSYYYQTNGYPSTSYSHVVWVHPTEVADDFNLYLYTDSGYSTLRASSTRSAGALEWVVFRPSSSQYYYPKVQRNSGVGYAYIEWEAGSSTLSIGIPLSASLSSSECIEVYRAYLTAGTPYNFTLDVPSSADYDLYLYYLSSGNAFSWNNYVGSSTKSGSGNDEKIADYSASYTDYYLIVVIRNSGVGTFSLSYVSNARIMLSDDSERSQNYVSSYTNVYYRTSSMVSSAYYHVVWLQPYDAYDDFDLYLFSDNSYSKFKASSTSGDGCLDWVIFCPTSSQYYYPMVDTKADTGNAYIEWEDGSSTLSSGYSVSGSLYYYDCIELYQSTLSTSKEYDFSLSVPSEGDFDLYLYFLNPGSAITGSSVYLMASVHASVGYDESIDDFQPPKSGNYAIIVVWKSGSGSYSLNLNSSNAPSDLLNPVITALLIMVLIAIIGVSVVAIYKYRVVSTSPPSSSQSAPSAPAMGPESSNKPKAYKQPEKQPEPSEPHFPQILKQKVRPFDYYCLYCGRLVRAGKKCPSCD